MNQLTQTQLGIYVDCANREGTDIYHMAYLFRMPDGICASHLAEALEKVVAAHPGLAARIVTDDNGVPCLTAGDTVAVQRITMPESELLANPESLVESFVLEGGELSRFKVIETDSCGVYFYLDIHHIIFDGYSYISFLKDLDLAYRGETLQPETYTLFDISREEQELRYSSRLSGAAAAVSGLLAGSEPVFDMPGDMNGTTESYERIVTGLNISEKDYRENCRRVNMPQSVPATAAAAVVLRGLCRRDDITLATIYHGRKSGKTDRTYTMAVKTLPLRVKFEPGETVGELLQSVKSNLKTVRDNDLYSFADAARDFGVNSDFLFAYQGDFMSLPTINGGQLREVRLSLPATGSKITAELVIRNGELELDIQYRSDIYSSRLMRSFASAYANVLSSILTGSGAATVSTLPFVTPEEGAAAVLIGTGEESTVPRDATIPQLFVESARRHRDKPGIVFDDKSYTYGEIDRITDSIAARLREEYGVGDGCRIGILIERSELMAILPLAVMKAGAAYMPLDPHFPAERLMFMIEDAEVNIIFSDPGLASSVIPDFAGHVIEPTLSDPVGECAPVCFARAESPMVVLYTSGSTGKPKGVTLTQRNIASFCGAYVAITGMVESDVTGAYASFGFDAHMLDLYPPLITGATVHILNSELRLDLIAMHDYMERSKITVMFMTTQIAWQMATLFEFTHLRLMSGGGEKLPPLTPRNYRFVNLYGPTECSVIATAYEVTGYTDGRLIGRPVPGVGVRILDRDLKPLPCGVAGELVILGDSVALGYLNRPELTAEKFIEIDGVRAYRTGDMARFAETGDIEFLGRMDGLVKLRGLRIELGEIEAVAATHPSVKSFVAVVKEIGGMENLAGYFTVKDNESLEPDELRDFMGGSLTEFMVPSVMMRLDNMPLTPNGKVDRRALPLPEVAVEKVVEPESATERRLFDIVSDILKQSSFGVTTNLLSVGLTSLLSMRFVASVMKELDVKITAKTVMSHPTIREIAAVVERSGSAGGMRQTERPKRRFYPLTENQRGVYIDWEMNRDALQYNIPQAFRFAPGTSAERLKEAVLSVVKAHPGLLTRFTLRNGDVMQVVPDDISVDVSITQLEEAPDRDFFQRLVLPFNLLDETLFRCEIFCHGDDVFMFRDTHHIIYDGVSAMIFQRELEKAYGGVELEPESYTALDHALEEKELLESGEADKAGEWFKTLVDGSEPTSYPKGAAAESDIPGAMGRISVNMQADVIRTFCAESGVTASNYMMAAFMQLLHRICREECVQIVTVNNGRSDVRLLDDTGMFVKTLPVVSRCTNPKISPRQFARSIQEQFLTSQDYDFYPFTDLVEKCGVRPDTMFVFEGGIDMSGGDGTLKPEKIDLSLDTAKVPLTVLVFEPSAAEYELVVEYDKSIYCREDMRVMLDMLATVCQTLPAAATLADARMVSDCQEKILEGVRRGPVCDVPYASLHGAMEYRADENPGAPALVACDKKMTYREFDDECNRIANALIKRGVRRGDRVVVLLPRRSSLITAIYGVMKTGAAYIPCDPEYPTERIRLITEDSGARFIITTADKTGLYPGKGVDVEELLRESDTARPGVKVDPEDVAYMIYTSGSTGRPKGVMIPQRAIANYVYGYYDRFYRNLPEVKTHMLIVTISFDASLCNLGVSLASGHCLVLANEEECKDVVMLSRLMLENKVDTADVTPSRLDAMLDLPEFREAISRCHHLNIGGEGFRNTLIDKLFKAGFKGLAVNEYGPTETTVGSNQSPVIPGGPIIAGPPFCNVYQRIIDAWGSELPVGAVGELYIFGRGVGLGYNNLPEKTAESYVMYMGDRGYRTGDLARWTPEGNVVILGRIDHQVKLRGLRIELGEIESVAQQFVGIRNVAADVREVNKIQHLCLYYTQDGPVDEAALRRHLASTLTEYMVPDAYMSVPEMPLTPNGKINRKQLPEPVIAELTPYVEPEGELERSIAAAFAKILGRDKIGANDDFFSIGGTSISAIKVVAALASAGHAITYKNVFTARTPRGLAALLSGAAGQEVSAEDHGDKEVEVSNSEFADVLGRNRVETFLKGERQEIGDVLLTGATGFMGIHMLRELLVNSGSRVVCLLREKGGIASESRLRTLLFYYFDDTFDDCFASGRIVVKNGDVTAPLPEEAYQWGVDTVINCAANVKHFSAGNDIELVNVESVRNLITFCLKTGARLVHVSTVSVAGESVNGVPDPTLLLDERMLDFGQSLANQYVHSKFEAERLVLGAIRDSGLNAKIMRVGNLSPRAADGEFQINFRSNAFMGRLKAYVTLGCAPYAALDAECEFSPIDEVCRAILLLATSPAELNMFIPCNNHRLPLGDVLQIINESGLNVVPVESGDFMARRSEAMANPELVTSLQPLMAYDSDEASRSVFIRYDAATTTQILYRLGFRWNETSHEYVARFLNAIKSLNFFDV